MHTMRTRHVRHWHFRIICTYVILALFRKMSICTQQNVPPKCFKICYFVMYKNIQILFFYNFHFMQLYLINVLVYVDKTNYFWRVLQYICIFNQKGVVYVLQKFVIYVTFGLESRSKNDAIQGSNSKATPAHLTLKFN